MIKSSFLTWFVKIKNHSSYSPLYSKLLQCALHTDHVEENIIQKTKQNYQLYMYEDKSFYTTISVAEKTAEIVQLGPSNGL